MHSEGISVKSFKISHCNQTIFSLCGGGGGDTKVILPLYIFQCIFTGKAGILTEPTAGCLVVWISNGQQAYFIGAVW